MADRYWVARGGSYTDGGAFAFTTTRHESGTELVCRNKFGAEISLATAGGGGSRTAGPEGSTDRTGRGLDQPCLEPVSGAPSAIIPSLMLTLRPGSSARSPRSPPRTCRRWSTGWNSA